MSGCDFNPLSSSPSPSLQELCALIRDGLPPNAIFEDAYEFVHARVDRWLPCIPDEYSRLRYTLFLLEKCVNEMACETAVRGETILERASVLELSFSMILKTGIPFDSLLKECTRRADRLESRLQESSRRTSLATLLKAIYWTKTPVKPSSLLDQLGKSVYSDVLIRDIIRQQIDFWDRTKLSNLIGRKIWDRGTNLEIRSLLLDIAAEHRLEVLTHSKTRQILIDTWPDSSLLLPLLRYIGECGLSSLIPVIMEKTQREKAPSLEVAFCILDVLSQLGADLSLPQVADVYTPLRDYVEAAVQSSHVCPERERGIQLVQCAFYGDVGLHGQAGAGGLSTLLNSLGQELAGMVGWERVYTLVFLHLKGADLKRPLIEKSAGGGHWVIRIPVSFPPENRPLQFCIHEYEIMRSVGRMFKRFGIDPDILHVRYSDNASKAVMLLAKRLDKRIVFTITPDPHRVFSLKGGGMGPPSEEEALEALNKVHIADQLLDTVDGLVLIGQGGRNDQIIPYFPRLLLDPDFRRKPIRVIPEGIHLEANYGRGESAARYIDLLTNHEGLYRFTKDFLRYPLLLNVGRLNPSKGQHRLFEAWSRSVINQTYNLLLVGGNLKNPAAEERELLEQFDRIMEKADHLRGRFCHLGALPNREVRLLERSVIESLPVQTPHVYLCSSLKEEFGISILEAMVAGFLIIAPRQGGVGSYIQYGRNGFLIDTVDVPSLQRGMESILLADIPFLWEVAREGMQYARETFSIDKISEIFSDFYSSLLSR